MVYNRYTYDKDLQKLVNRRILRYNNGKIL